MTKNMAVRILKMRMATILENQVRRSQINIVLQLVSSTPTVIKIKRLDQTNKLELGIRITRRSFKATKTRSWTQT